jgi:hypothetical protein
MTYASLKTIFNTNSNLGNLFSIPHCSLHYSWADSSKYGRDEVFHQTFPPLEPVFCQKASLWPGSKGVARKKHRREKK